MDMGDKSENLKTLIKMMIYIGFSKKTHKLHAHIICRKYKHCVPIVILKKQFVLYQFVRPNKIVKLLLTKRDLKILEKNGWKLIKYKIKNTQHKYRASSGITCVQFTKKFCGIKKITIQTPDALLRYLLRK